MLGKSTCKIRIFFLDVAWSIVNCLVNLLVKWWKWIQQFDIWFEFILRLKMDLNEESQNSDEEEFHVSHQFVPYIPNCQIGESHPEDVCETATLNYVNMPTLLYTPLIKTMIKPRSVSNIQFETVAYACQKHEEFMQGKRCGFLLGKRTLD